MKNKQPDKWLAKVPFKLQLLLILILNFPAVGYCSSELELANIAKSQGHFVTAINHWKTLLTELNQAHKIPVLIQIAESYLALGQIQQAFQFLKEADALSTEHTNSLTKIQILNLFSDLHLLTRDTEQALDFASNSTALARKLNDKKTLSNTLNHQGNVQMAMQNYQQALDSYHEAINLSAELGYKEFLSKIQINSIHAYLALDLYDKAILTIQQSLKVTMARKDSQDKAVDLIATGHLIQQIINNNDRYVSELQQPALQAYTAALNIGNATKNRRAQSYAYGHLGELYLSAKKLPDAETLLRKALFTAEENQIPELSARWYWQLGRLKQLQKHNSAAINLYQKAISDLESIESALIYGYRGKPRAFRDTIGIIYLELAELLLQQSAQVQQPKKKQQVLKKVKLVMEQFKSFELKNYFQDDCVTELQNKLITTAVDNILEPTTATLYPIVFADRLIILLSLSNGETKHFETSLSSSKLKQTVLSFREQISHPGNPRRLRSLGLKLYSWLIKPLEQTLQHHSINTLVIVPDGVLRGIPYAALFNGENFLIANYALAVSPGLNLTNRSKATKTNNAILLMGLSEAVQNYTPLPFVTEEITKIANVYDDNNFFLNQDFQKNKIKQQLSEKSYSTAVFSTHAYLAADPKQSFLLTYDNKINLDELEQFIRKTSFHDQPLDLLVLSACDTAQGDDRAMLGLAGIAVKSGAKSVLASLWSVNDASTAELIPAFFQQLKKQKTSKAKALQLAQKQLLASKQYRHPYYWAGFELIGEWQ